ncbi:hypothetical protein ABPG75_011914 [Micractinium tetrahymenae]
MARVRDGPAAPLPDHRCRPRWRAAAAVAAALALAAALLFSSGRHGVRMPGRWRLAAAGTSFTGSGSSRSASSNGTALWSWSGGTAGAGGGCSDAPPGSSDGSLPCAGSCYCSLGRVGVWSGDVATNEALRQMLEVVAFRREVIMTLASDAQRAENLMNALNLILSARDMGYAHAVLLVWEERECQEFIGPFRAAAGISCVWDSRRSEPSAGPFHDFVAKRWEVAARVVRMGYNLLLLDSGACLLCTRELRWLAGMMPTCTAWPSPRPAPQRRPAARPSRPLGPCLVLLSAMPVHLPCLLLVCACMHPRCLCPLLRSVPSLWPSLQTLCS